MTILFSSSGIQQTQLARASIVSAVFLVAVVPITPLSAGLVLHLKFDEVAGTNASDSSDSKLSGTLLQMNDADWIPGVAGGSLDFDGTNDSVQVDDSPLLDFGSGDFSVSYWVNKKATTAGFDNLYGVSKWGSGAIPGTNEWLLNIGTGSSTDRPSFVLETGAAGGGYSANSPDEITLDEWHHLVGVREGSRIRIYVDGVLKGENTQLEQNVSVNNNGRALSIAANTQPTNALFWTRASIDDIQIYDSALDGGEIGIGTAAQGDVKYLFENPGRVQSEGDLDGDGMPNGWEELNGLDPKDAGDASIDSDGGGLQNLIEFVMQTNPRLASDDVSPFRGATHDAGGMCLSFEIPTELPDSISVTAEVGDGLEVWTDAGAPESGVGIDQVTGANGLSRIEVLVPAGVHRKFARLVFSSALGD